MTPYDVINPPSTIFGIRCKRKANMFTKIFPNNNGMLKCTFTTMLLKKNGNIIIMYNEELYMKVRILGKPVVHYAFAMATSKTADKQSSHPNVGRMNERKNPLFKNCKKKNISSRTCASKG